MPKKTPSPSDQGRDHDLLLKQIETLTGELLQERITRIDFQVQLLKQWQDQCQRKLNRLRGGEEGQRSIEGDHG